MKSFIYNKANPVKVSNNEIKENLDLLRATVVTACEQIHSNMKYDSNSTSYTGDIFHISWGTDWEVGKPTDLFLDFKVKYCKTNNTYWVDFYINTILIRTESSYRKYKTDSDNSMTVGLTVEEIKVRNLVKVISDFINSYYPNIFDVL